MSKVRKDSHGLYIITNGAIFRPVISDHTYPGWTCVSESVASEGQSVKSRFLSYSPVAKIRFEDGTEERWSLHGSASDSEKAWMPHTRKDARFELGNLATTSGAVFAFREAKQSMVEFINRHVTGDWGEVDAHDANENELSVERGFRILSAYTLSTGVKFWIITEADRSVTTVLLPSEY